MFNIIARLIVAFAFVFPGVCLADFYRYTDKDGITHFTDDLGNIPEDQRIQIETYRKSETLAAPTNEPPAKTAPATSPGQTGQTNDQSKLESLEARKAALDMERAQLEAEQMELAQKGQKLRTGVALRGHKRRMRELNGLVVTYRGKRDAFEKDWQAYYSLREGSPESESLMARKAALDVERAQLEAERAELAEKIQKVRSMLMIRADSRRMKEVNDRLVAHHKKRDAFEKDWQACYSSK